MFEEKLDKMAGPKRPIPSAPNPTGGAVSKPQNANNQELMSSANRAIEDYTAKASGARHSYGKGIPANHEALS